MFGIIIFKDSDSRSLQCELGTLYQTYHPKFKSKKYFKQSYTTSSIPKQSPEHHL
ncbi:MAG: Hypothetical protein AJITA_00884 [Acetilactobacillus jinshanensis]